MINVTKLRELQAQCLPRLNWEDMLKPTEGCTYEDVFTPAQRALMHRHFTQFLPAVDGCVGCGKQLGAKNIMEGLLGVGTFQWGYAHGCGYCIECGYPGQAIHEIFDPPGVLLFRLELILQPHPDEIFKQAEDSGCPL